MNWPNGRCAIMQSYLELLILSLRRSISAYLVHMENVAHAWTDLEVRYGGSNAPILILLYMRRCVDSDKLL